MYADQGRRSRVSIDFPNKRMPFALKSVGPRRKTKTLKRRIENGHIQAECGKNGSKERC
jgi:hypothetical protein